MNIKYLSLLIFLFLSAFLFSQQTTLEYNPDELTLAVKNLADKIGKTNVIHSNAIGYSGEKSHQYKNFENLISTAKPNELVQLMNHPKPAVRGYVFWALAKIQYQELDKILFKHINDNEIVFLMMGCVGDELAVIEFMKWVVTPEMIDVDCKKLEAEVLKKLEKV